MRYSHDSWSIDLPKDWQVEETLEVTSFFHEDGAGSFEVSTFFKDDGNITIEDIIAFAEVESPEEVTLPYLKGIHKTSVEAEEAVFEWWLATANQMIYATYVCDVGNEGAEKTERHQLASSLRSLYQDLDA